MLLNKFNLEVTDEGNIKMLADLKGKAPDEWYLTHYNLGLILLGLKHTLKPEDWAVLKQEIMEL